MHRDQPSAGKLTGSLLVAHPNLRDPNFCRTILFLSHHNAEDGAVGLVLNRPTRKRIDDYEVDGLGAAVGRVPVFIGGPVADEELVLVSLQWASSHDTVAFQGFGDPTNVDDIPENLRDGLRAFLGYAGWSRGQLESEIAQKAWLVLPPSRQLIAPSNSEQTWRDLMRSLGPVYHLLAEMPDDPSLN